MKRIYIVLLLSFAAIAASAQNLTILHMNDTHSHIDPERSGKYAGQGGVMHHDAYHYQGVLQITDAEAFRKALQQGIGSGKAYGFGMMMVKRL